MKQKELQQQMSALRELERGIRPDPVWLCRQRETLFMQVKNSMPVHDSISRRWRTVLRQLFPNAWKHIFRAPTLALFSLFGVVTGGSLLSVSAAERSLPGDVLYPIKLAAEQTRILFTGGKTEKVKLKAEFVGRRADEIQKIATTNVSKRQERLHEATEILKRDLDTVNVQLHEAAAQNSVADVALAARVVDQASDSLASTLRGVKIILPEEEKGELSGAEAAAVNTGVKAVQVLIESQDKLAEQNAVLTPDQLKESIQNKMQGMEDHMADAALKLSAASGTSNGEYASSTSVSLSDAEATSSTNQQIKTAQQSLTEARQLLEENNLQAVKERLVDAAKVVTSVEKTMVMLPTVASGTTMMVGTTSTNISEMKSKVDEGSSQPTLP